MIKLNLKLKRKSAFLLAVVIMFTTAFILPDFAYKSYADETGEMEETTTEVIMSEQGSCEGATDGDEDELMVDGSNLIDEPETPEEIENIEGEKSIGNISDNKLFSVKNQTGRKIISFDIILSGQISASNMLSEDFEANEERNLYFNFSSGIDYDLVIKFADGSNYTLASFDLADMASLSSNPENKVLLMFSADDNKPYLSYASKNTLEDEKKASDEVNSDVGVENDNDTDADTSTDTDADADNTDGITVNENSDNTNVTDENGTLSEENRVVIIDTTLSDEEFVKKYGFTKAEYEAIVNSNLPTVPPLFSLNTDTDADEITEDLSLLGASGTYSVQSMFTPSLWGTVGMIATMQDSDGNVYPSANAHALCIDHRRGTDHGTNGVTYTMSIYADNGISAATARLLVESYYFTYGAGQGIYNPDGLSEDQIHALASYTASYLVNGSASVGSTIASHCAAYVSWMENNSYSFRLAGDEVNDTISNNTQTGVSTKSTNTTNGTSGMFQSNTMTYTTTGDMVYYVICPANCKITVNYADNTSNTVSAGQQIWINNNSQITLYADTSLANSTTTLTFNTVNDVLYMPHALYVFNPSNSYYQPLLVPEFYTTSKSASVSWVGTGNISLVKASSNTAITNNNSCYSLQGAVYGVYGSRADANNGTNRITTITTDASGHGTSGALNYGTYYVKEITASKGYSLDTTVHTATISATVQSPVVSSSERPRSDPANVAVIKKGTIERLPVEGAIFEVKYYATDSTNQINNTTYRRHWYIRTDDTGHGRLDNLHVTTYNGNSSDAFYIDADANIPTFPIGYITVQEVYVPTGYIIDNTVHTYRTTDTNTNTSVTNERTVTNDEQPDIKTTALDSKTNEHTGIVGESVTVVDKVDCTNLVIGKEYTIKGMLFDTTTKLPYIDNTGKTVTAEKTFTATEKDPTIYIEFTYNTTDLKGETITVFETLYNNNTAIALHSDIDDQEQQIHYPDVHTTALDGVTDTQTGVVGEKVTVIDKVECTNLIVGKEYEIKGKLYNTETGGAILENGKEVTASKKYTATEVNPVIDLEFTLNSTTLKGETIVVFEDLYHNDIKVATHSDLTDENQQVHYPEVGTTAVDKDTDSKSGVVGNVATIVDAVECKNLIIGQEYTVKGKLYDTETGKPFLDNGKEVTAEKTFKADKKDMKVDLTFKFSSLALEGKTTTVFEDLYTNGVKVASHSDLDDRDQQVDYPRVKTTAKDKVTDNHTGIRNEKVTVVDTVECTNLIIGKEYTVKGKLYNTETGEVFLDNGKEVTAEKTFKADKKDMTVELEFTFNSTSLEGETIVVFEDLYHKGIKVDTHNRLDDKDQQVHYPKIATTAKNPVDGGKVFSPDKNVKLNDTVDIKAIGKNEKFVLRGVLYDKSTGEKLLIDGKEVTASSEFTSIDENMKTDVIFTFDATTLAGKDLVVFEYLYIVKEDGTEVLVASHEDINDEGQTIRFSTQPKTGDRGFLSMFVLLLMSIITMYVLTILRKKWL